MIHSSIAPVVFFDGYCNLCSASVRFLMRNDPGGRLHFASLQSDVALELLGEIPDQGTDPATLVLLENGQKHFRSDAALRIAGHLRYPWKVGKFFLVVPRVVRDAVYNLIARNRYSWFGRSDSCMVPTKENLERFIQSDT